MFCTNCGNKLNENDNFCKLCGTPIIKSQLDQKTEVNLPKKETDIREQEDDNLVMSAKHQNKQKEKQITSEKCKTTKLVNIDVLKLLSFISIIIFFLPINLKGDWLFSILHGNEPTAVSVPIFVLSLILFMVFLTNIGTEKGLLKTSLIFGAVNSLLSIFLIIPTPLHTQVICLGSYLIFIINFAIFIYALIRFLVKRDIEYVHKDDYTENQQKNNNEMYKKTFSHRVTLKLVTVCALIAFVLPCMVTSCDINDPNSSLQVKTGIDIMSNFTSGIGNAFAIAVFVLFIVILISLFVKEKEFFYIPFILGTVNIIMLVMTKVIFYENIKKYLVGSYIVFIASVIISSLGYIYYKKMIVNNVTVTEKFNRYSMYSESQKFINNSREENWSNKRLISVVIACSVLIIGILTTISLKAYRENSNGTKHYLSVDNPSTSSSSNSKNITKNKTNINMISNEMKKDAVNNALKFAQYGLQGITWYDPSGIYAGPEVNYFGPGKESAFISDMDIKMRNFKDKFSTNNLSEKRHGFSWLIRGIKTSQDDFDENSGKLTVHVVFDSYDGIDFGDEHANFVNSETYITMSPYVDEKGEVKCYYISKVRLIIDNLVDAVLE